MKNTNTHTQSHKKHFNKIIFSSKEINKRSIEELNLLKKLKKEFNAKLFKEFGTKHPTAGVFRRGNI